MAPLACENFLALITGSKGKSSGSGKALHYKDCPFHRIVPGFVAQVPQESQGVWLSQRAPCRVGA